MKTAHFLVLFSLTMLFGCAQTVVAQNEWPRPNSEWNFAFGGPPYYGYARYYVNGTETIQGKTCTRLIGDSYFLSNYTQGAEPSYLWYFDGDTLWHYVESETVFHPLVCFNAVPGDTWYPLDTAIGDATCSNSPMEVTDTFSVYHNGQAFRGVTVQTEVDGYIWWGGSFNERTFMDTATYSNGNPYFGYNPFPQYNGCSGVVDWFFYSLLCYSDTELDIVVNNISSIEGHQNCDYPWNEVSVHGLDSVENLLFYPNPTSNRIQIDLGSTIGTITINAYNALGELVSIETRNSQGRIDYILPDPIGIYLLQLVHTDGNVTNLKVVKE